MSFKSSDHYAVHHTLRTTRGAQLCCLLNAARKLYQEIFISIKQLHGNSRTAQGDPPAKLPSCLSLFLGTSEWRGYPVSHLSERSQPTSEKRERQSKSLNQLIGFPTTKPTRSQLEVALHSLSPSLSLWFEVWQLRAASILKSANYYQTEFDQMVI